MVTYTLERVIFQRQKDGSFDYSIVVSYLVDDPVTGTPIVQSIGPIVPNVAKDKFGIDLAAVMDAKTEAAILANGALQSDNDRLKTSFDALKQQIDEITKTNNFLVGSLNQISSVLAVTSQSLNPGPNVAEKVQV